MVEKQRFHDLPFKTIGIRGQVKSVGSFSCYPIPWLMPAENTKNHICHRFEDIAESIWKCWPMRVVSSEKTDVMRRKIRFG
jgi:hypothetical protein